MSNSSLPDIKVDAKINSKDLAKVTNRFIERLSRGLGKLYEPTHIRRIARAEADAMLIRTEAEIRTAELQERAVQRLLAAEARKQANLDSTIEYATQFLESEAQPERISDDFLGEWEDRASKVSDKEMQILWAKIIAGEANAPGSFNKRTLEAVALLEKSEAENFVSICKFAIALGKPEPLILDYKDEIYARHGLTFASISELVAAGLIFFETSGFERSGVSQTLASHYQSIVLIFDMKGKNKLPSGMVRFTSVGHQLFPLSNAGAIAEFPQYVAAFYEKKGIGVEVLQLSA